MDSRDKIFSPTALQNQLAQWRDQGDKIVFTNGCFDLVHLGHVDYLEKARKLGDRLVIGLNSDDSVAQLKGAGRPIIDEQSRARILAAITFGQTFANGCVGQPTTRRDSSRGASSSRSGFRPHANAIPIRRPIR